MDSTGKEHSVDPQVVMVVIVVMIDAAFSWAVLSGGLGCCSTGTWAAMSTMVGWPRADGPGRKSIAGPSTPQARISLDSSVHSLTRARMQLAPYRRGWPL